MARNSEPWWKEMHEERLQAKRDRIVELAATSPTYPRPERDPAIKFTGYDGKIALLDENTGDILVMHSAERERKLIDYAFRTASGELVAIYKVQIITGYPEKIDFVPYRLYSITYNQDPSQTSIDARSRISPAKFSQFLASDPDYSDNPEIRFIVIDAPLEEGEDLV